MAKPKVSIVVPVLNERENIEELVERLYKAMRRRSYEIVFVDAGSTDGTVEKIKEISNMYEIPIRLLFTTGGLTSSFNVGYEGSEGDIIVFMDGDLQHPPETVPKLLNEVKNTPIVVASRYMKGSSLDMSFIRRFLSKTATVLTRIILPETRRTTDPLSGFFCLDKKRLDVPKLDVGGYKILIEILVANPCVDVKDVPYNFARRKWGESKMRISTILWLVAQWVKHLWYSKRC